MFSCGLQQNWNSEKKCNVVCGWIIRNVREQVDKVNSGGQCLWSEFIMGVRCAVCVIFLFLKYEMKTSKVYNSFINILKK